MPDFAGLRVLVVEDEGPVALLLEDLLEEFGCVVAVSAARLDDAWKALSSVSFDFAVIDVNVGGENSFDLARALIEREIPFVFSTGYGSSSLPVDLAPQVVLTKPFALDDLRRAIEERLT